MGDLRVGVVGLGYAGQSLHLPALAAERGVHLVAACDAAPERRSEVEERWRVPTFDDLDVMLGQSSLDVVVVGTPPNSHAAVCLKAIAAGAHVVCEKPLAGSVVEADTVIAAAQRASRTVAVNHEFRHMTIFRAVKDALASEGELRFVQVWQLMDLPPWRERGWRQTMLTRVLYEAGIHLVDYVIWLFGARPNSVAATVSSCGASEDDSDAVALVTLTFPGGGVAQITQNRLCVGETQYMEVRADARQASLRASFGGRARLSAGLHRSTRPHLRVEWGAAGIAWSERGHGRRIIARNPREPAAHATQLSLRRALEAIRRGETPPVTAEEARDVLEVIAACYVSAQTGSRIDLAEDSALRTEARQLRLADN